MLKTILLSTVSFISICSATEDSLGHNPLGHNPQLTIETDFPVTGAGTGMGVEDASEVVPEMGYTPQSSTTRPKSNTRYIDTTTKLPDFEDGEEYDGIGQHYLNEEGVYEVYLRHPFTFLPQAPVQAILTDAQLAQIEYGIMPEEYIRDRINRKIQLPYILFNICADWRALSENDVYRALTRKTTIKDRIQCFNRVSYAYYAIAKNAYHTDTKTKNIISLLASLVLWEKPVDAEADDIKPGFILSAILERSPEYLSNLMDALNYHTTDIDSSTEERLYGAFMEHKARIKHLTYARMPRSAVPTLAELTSAQSALDEIYQIYKESYRYRESQSALLEMMNLIRRDGYSPSKNKDAEKDTRVLGRLTKKYVELKSKTGTGVPLSTKHAPTLVGAMATPQKGARKTVLGFHYEIKNQTVGKSARNIPTERRIRQNKTYNAIPLDDQIKLARMFDQEAERGLTFRYTLLSQQTGYTETNGTGYSPNALENFHTSTYIYAQRLGEETDVTRLRGMKEVTQEEKRNIKDWIRRQPKDLTRLEAAKAFNLKKSAVDKVYAQLETTDTDIVRKTPEQIKFIRDEIMRYKRESPKMMHKDIADAISKTLLTQEAGLSINSLYVDKIWNRYKDAGSTRKLTKDEREEVKRFIKGKLQKGDTVTPKLIQEQYPFLAVREAESLIRYVRVNPYPHRTITEDIFDIIKSMRENGDTVSMISNTLKINARQIESMISRLKNGKGFHQKILPATKRLILIRIQELRSQNNNYEEMIRLISDEFANDLPVVLSTNMLHAYIKEINEATGNKRARRAEAAYESEEETDMRLDGVSAPSSSTHSNTASRARKMYTSAGSASSMLDDDDMLSDRDTSEDSDSEHADSDDEGLYDTDSDDNSDQGQAKKRIRTGSAVSSSSSSANGGGSSNQIEK